MGLFNIVKEFFNTPPRQPAPAPAKSASSSQPPPPTRAADASAQSTTPVRAGRTLLIHGYSASGLDLKPWQEKLAAKGIEAASIAVGNYISLNNEVTIKDLGEAFDRALRLTQWSSGSKDDKWTFDAIVHSTGMLVLRQWLVGDPFPANDERSRLRRLKHLVGIAPATFGSPQGKKGRSWLGALVKGNKHLGPDFLNAGDQVLDALELASSYTWDLAMKDMLGETPFYAKGSNTPYVTVFIGNSPYDGVASIANSPGTDGTVRWAGCALNTRKVSVDLRREPRLVGTDGKVARVRISPWAEGRLAAPMIAVDGKNHGSIASEPDEEVADLIKRFFFDVADESSYTRWEADAIAFGAKSMPKMNAASKEGESGGAGWQQLVIHMLDDHGDGVKDFNLQLFIGDELEDSDDATFPAVPLIADAYSGDSSYRCFYIRLSDDMLSMNKEGGPRKKMWLELIASSGSALLEYEAYTGNPGNPSPPQRLTIDHVAGLGGNNAVKLEITGLTQGDTSLLYPYTTTLLEIFVEREPLPLDKVSTIFGFLPPDPAAGS